MINIFDYPDRLAKLVIVSPTRPDSSKEFIEKQSANEKLLRKISNQVDINKPEEVEKAREAIKILEELLVISQHSDGRPEDVLGIGLAAIQVRELAEKEWVPRVSVIRLPYNKGKPLVLNLINPQIIRGIHTYKHSGEGCLSYPGVYLSTKRFYGVRLGFVDAVDLKPREMELYGIEAVCVQHEVDHHDGLIFKDKHNFPLEIPGKPGPNDSCPCGKKKEGTEIPMKYKKCCGSK